MELLSDAILLTAALAATLAILFAYSKVVGTGNWKERGITGFPHNPFVQIAFALLSLGAGILGLLSVGFFFGYACGAVLYLLLISSATDITSAKAPRELTTFAALIAIASGVADWLLPDGSVTEYSFFYLAAGLITWLLLALAVRIVSPGGLGMADVRVLGVIALFSLWLTPIILLLAVLIAAPTQLIARMMFKKLNSLLNLPAGSAPYIPSLTFAAVASIPVCFFILA